MSNLRSATLPICEYYYSDDSSLEMSNHLDSGCFTEGVKAMMGPISGETDEADCQMTAARVVKRRVTLVMIRLTSEKVCECLGLTEIRPLRRSLEHRTIKGHQHSQFTLETFHTQVICPR
jgi:hypothetical protein